MSIDRDKFLAASEAAESWASTIANARHYASKGEVKVAYGLLLELWTSNPQHAVTLWNAADDLAAVSDPPIIRHHGMTGLRSYASAHAAIHDITETICLMLGDPSTITDVAELENAARRFFNEHREALEIDESLLQARIQRERAKLLATKPAAQPTETGSQWSPTEVRLFAILLNKHPGLVLQNDLVDVSRQTASPLLDRMRELGYTHRPKGERKGEGLTDKGVQIATQLATRFPEVFNAGVL